MKIRCCATSGSRKLAQNEMFPIGQASGSERIKRNTASPANRSGQLRAQRARKIRSISASTPIASTNTPAQWWLYSDHATSSALYGRGYACAGHVGGRGARARDGGFGVHLRLQLLQRELGMLGAVEARPGRRHARAELGQREPALAQVDRRRHRDQRRGGEEHGEADPDLDLGEPAQRQERRVGIVAQALDPARVEVAQRHQGPGHRHLHADHHAVGGAVEAVQRADVGVRERRRAREQGGEARGGQPMEAAGERVALLALDRQGQSAQQVRERTDPAARGGLVEERDRAQHGLVLEPRGRVAGRGRRAEDHQRGHDVEDAPAPWAVARRTPAPAPHRPAPAPRARSSRSADPPSGARAARSARRDPSRARAPRTPPEPSDASVMPSPAAAQQQVSGLAEPRRARPRDREQERDAADRERLHRQGAAAQHHRQVAEQVDEERQARPTARAL